MKGLHDMFTITSTLLENGQTQLTVIADPSEVHEALSEGLGVLLTRMGLNVSEDMAPLDFVKGIAGEENADDFVRSSVMNYMTPMVMTQAEVASVAAPDQDSEEVPQAGKPFTYTVTFFEKGSYTLDSYETIDLPLLVPGPVTEEEVDGQLSMLINALQAQKGEDAPALTLADIDDAWVEENMKEMGIQSMEHLRSAMRAAAEHVQEDDVVLKEQKAAMAAWAERLIEKPQQSLIEAFAEDMYYAVMMELSQKGFTMEKFLSQEGKTEEEFRAENMVRAEQALCESFMLDAIFDHEEMELTDEWIHRAAQALVQEGDIDEALETFKREGRYYMIEENAQRSMAADWVMGHTTFAFYEE